MKHLRGGEVVKETREFEYAATNLSPREAGAEVLDKLLRRHWMIENRNHYVRDTHWNEDRARWRTGPAAFVMFALVGIAMNLLRARSSRWTDDTPMPRRSMAADHAITVAPQAVLRKPP